MFWIVQTNRFEAPLLVPNGRLCWFPTESSWLTFRLTRSSFVQNLEFSGLLLLFERQLTWVVPLPFLPASGPT